MGALAQAAPKANTPTPVPPGIAAPDTMETRLGTLKFFDGFPDEITVAKLYDNLDLNDHWYRWVVDVGVTGPDKGQGGKYLILPPGHEG